MDNEEQHPNAGFLNLEQDLLRRLSKPVRTKHGTIVTDPETGKPLTNTQAIAMSILQNAMRGDITSATFIRNITRTSPVTEEEFRNRYEENLQSAATEIRESLKQENLYIEQEYEILQLAHQRVQLDRMRELQLHPDFDYTTKEYMKDGRAQVRMNSIIETYDYLYEKFTERMKELRTESFRRKQNIKNRGRR